MALISNKEMEIFVKIAQGFPNLSEFDKGYFLGVVESRAAFREQQEINKDVEGHISVKEKKHEERNKTAM